MERRRVKLARGFLLFLTILPLGAPAQAEKLIRPDVVLITVDTLRYDRLSAHGYERPTSPHLDGLLEKSARFDQARVVESLTAPSMISIITSRYPHEHAASRNGLRMRPKILGLGKILAARGYATVALVGNWTLRDQLTGLAEHFDEYREVLNRKRWFGLFYGEATAEDLTDEALGWIDEHLSAGRRHADRRRPFFLWVHYAEPHAPYRLHKDFIETLGLPQQEKHPPSDRYDTEVAFVDRAIGRLLRGLDKTEGPEGTLTVFTSDHGESLGEHGYWGHGRHTYDVTLRVPLSFAWEGHIVPRSFDTLTSSLDIAPTVLGLVGLPSPDQFEGFDWSSVLRGEAQPPAGRVTYHQAHKGVSKGRSENARQKGLLEVALVEAAKKEILSLKTGSRHTFDVLRDPYEIESEESKPLAALLDWLEEVQKGLAEADNLPAIPLDEASIERMRALGYVE